MWKLPKFHDLFVAFIPKMKRYNKNSEIKYMTFNIYVTLTHKHMWHNIIEMMSHTVVDNCHMIINLLEHFIKSHKVFFKSHINCQSHDLHFVGPSVCLSVHLSVCLSVRLSIRLPVQIRVRRRTFLCFDIGESF